MPQRNYNASTFDGWIVERIWNVIDTKYFVFSIYGITLIYRLVISDAFEVFSPEKKSNLNKHIFSSWMIENMNKEGKFLNFCLPYFNKLIF